MKSAIILIAILAVAFALPAEKKPEAKKAEKQADKPVEKPTEKPADKPTEKPSEKPAEKPTEKPAEKPEEKDKPTEKPEAKPTEKPAEKPADKPAEKPAEKGEEKEKPAEKQDDKPLEKPVEKPAEDKPAEKPAEKERRGLEFPLPEPRSEGDLILYGSHIYDRVEELKKGKAENDLDKMILSFGREYLRKVHKYLEATPDFKILPALCRDSRELNSTSRWAIRLEPEHAPAGDKKEEEQKEKPAQGEQAKPQNDAPQPQNDKPLKKEEVKPSNATEVANVTEAPVATEAPKLESADSYEARRADYYRRLGDNFARLLLRKYRKEELSMEERQYIDEWSEEEAIRYGLVGIYCHEGENGKELIKKIEAIVSEK